LKTEVLIADVEIAAPLIFDIAADIVTEDVGVAELKIDVEFEEVGTDDEVPDPDIEDE
jgi:hypothetical protein